MLIELPKGSVLAFDFHAPEGHWEPRMAILWGVRDLEKEPLSAQAIADRPDLERSRYLLRMWDVVQQQERHFYHKRIRNWRLADPLPALLVAREKLRRAC